MKYTYLLVLLITMGSLFSCKKFLDVQPKGIVIPGKTADYDGLLNSYAATYTFPLNMLDFTDDTFNQYDNVDQSSRANGYYWRSLITANDKESPDVWNSYYNTIYYTNVIINGVMKASDGTVAKKQSLLSEALVLRANSYMVLMTVFAKAYNAGTADSDPGLPLVTSTNVTGKTPQRATVKNTLEMMINDCKQASDVLPEANISRYRITKYVAYAVLGRIYLYMADYVNAKKYVDLALKAPHKLLNFNDYSDPGEVPVYPLSPEILWMQSASSGSTFGLLYSEELKGYFDGTDIRYIFLTSINGPNVAPSDFGGPMFGISFPEMYLTRAEILAREGNFNEAMDMVNLIRKNRIKTANYQDQTAASGEEALLKVLAERRRELAFMGMRWFDMKRLDQEGRMPEVKRINPETNEVIAKLPPHSPKYTFEIPLIVQRYNPDMKLNHK